MSNAGWNGSHGTAVVENLSMRIVLFLEETRSSSLPKWLDKWFS
jgi:hypothetical protein